MPPMKKFLFCIVITLGSLAAHGADTYDPARGTLSIPLVKVGTAYYADVLVTLGNVISVGAASGNPPTYDTYDAATNRLAIPVVGVGAATYYNVVATVGKVLRVGATCATLEACTGGRSGVAIELDQVAGSVVATVNMNTATGYLGSDVLFYNLLGKGDINGDGYEDLVIGLFRHTSSPS